MNKIIIRIDASSIKESDCDLKLALTVEGYGGELNNSDVIYGSAFHKCVETYELTNRDKSAATLAGLQYWNKAEESGKMIVKEKKDHLNSGHLMFSMSKYYNEVDSHRDIFSDNRVLVIKDRILVEQKFSFKIYEDEHFIVLLQGTIDKLVRLLRSGIIAVGDWKTTSAWNIEDYFAGYRMSAQLRIYVLAVIKLAERYPNGAAAQVIKDAGGIIKAFIFGAFLKNPVGVEFQRSEIYSFSRHELEAFEKELLKVVKKLCEDLRGMIFDSRYPAANGVLNGACNAPFGGLCKYFGVCSQTIGSVDRDKLLRGLLNTKYNKREYRPLTFGGGL